MSSDHWVNNNNAVSKEGMQRCANWFSKVEKRDSDQDVLLMYRVAHQVSVNDFVALVDQCRINSAVQMMPSEQVPPLSLKSSLLDQNRSPFLMSSPKGVPIAANGLPAAHVSHSSPVMSDQSAWPRNTRHLLTGLSYGNEIDHALRQASAQSMPSPMVMRDLPTNPPRYQPVATALHGPLQPQYVCPGCDKPYRVKRHIIAHIQKKHKDNEDSILEYMGLAQTTYGVSDGSTSQQSYATSEMAGNRTSIRNEKRPQLGERSFSLADTQIPESSTRPTSSSSAALISTSPFGAAANTSLLYQWPHDFEPYSQQIPEPYPQQIPRINIEQVAEHSAYSGGTGLMYDLQAAALDARSSVQLELLEEQDFVMDEDFV